MFYCKSENPCILNLIHLSHGPDNQLVDFNIGRQTQHVSDIVSNVFRSDTLLWVVFLHHLGHVAGLQVHLGLHGAGADGANPDVRLHGPQLKKISCIEGGTDDHFWGCTSSLQPSVKALTACFEAE